MRRFSVILSSLLFFSACEKKRETTPSSAADEEAGPSKLSMSTRADRRGETRAERETAAKSELRKALEAAEGESDPVAREKALAQVAWDGIDIDPIIAQRAFNGLTRGSEESRKLVAHFAMRMADDNPDAALEWVRNLEQVEERDAALGRIAGVIADKDPTLAATLATGEVAEGPLRDRAVVQVVQRWAQKEPANAGDWVGSLPEGPGRKAALINVAKIWSNSDATSFANWASTQESKFPEIYFAVATVLRFLPDETARKERLTGFSSAEFRGKVQAELDKGASQFSVTLPTPK